MKPGKKVLVVTTDFPFPPNCGGRVDIWNNLLLMRSIGADIDLITTVKVEPNVDSIQKVREVVRELTIIPRNHDLRSAIGLNPFQIESRKELRSLPLKDEYDVVFVDSDYATPIYDNPELRANCAIQRIHNDEARFQLDMARATKSLFRKIFFAIETARFTPYQLRYRRRADWLFFISDYERAQFVKTSPDMASRSMFVPPSLDASAAKRRTLAGNRVLYVATLALPSNQAGLRWYLRNVHRELLSIQGYELLVAGNTLDQDLEICREAQQTQRVILIKDPDELESLYESGAAFINPILHGAGLKLKTVGALLAGLPVITTSVGAEGTGLVDGEHLQIRNESDSFAGAVRELLANKQLAQNLVSTAQEFIRERYDTRAVFRRIINGES